jgi:RNA polymerase sigma-70 factor (ECF subfamily)
VTDAGALDRFLADVEKRALRMAQFSVNDVDEAMDIVQDAMLTLVRKYATKPEAEWRPLFFRILKNRITDWHRRRTVRSKVIAVFRPTSFGEEQGDRISRAADGQSAEPEWRAVLDSATETMSDAVAALPERQRQAFLLRAWEGFNVAETARAMKCSQGSVKTHYSRAVHRLRERLEDTWE